VSGGAAQAVVAIVSVGDEIILGQIEDTNASWIARELQRIGAMPGERRAVADDRAALARTLRELSATHAAIVMTGGLGPTLDDLTRESLGDVVDPGAALVRDPAGVEHLRDWFERRGRAMPELNLRQADRPPSARLLDNPHGTAPGISARVRGPGMGAGCDIFCLPGPPNEMRPMFEQAVVPALRTDGRVVLTAALHTIGLGESRIAEQLGDLMRRDRVPSVGTTASDGIVTIRVRAAGAEEWATCALDQTVAECRSRVGSIVFGENGEPLASVVGRLLVSRGMHLATAESCTGGLLGAFLTEIAGSSAWYQGGFVTYANARKVRDLGVPLAILQEHGAVSHETAIDMARGCLRASGADMAIATTGIAGPTGGSDDKPVGTVFVSVGLRGGQVFSRRFHFPGDRTTVRRRTAHLALACARFTLLGEPTRSLLWSEAEAVRIADA
jgi:nicotinamide-nucleotide amidase